MLALGRVCVIALTMTGCRQLLGFETPSVATDAAIDAPIDPATDAVVAEDVPVDSTSVAQFRKPITIAANQVEGPLLDFPLLVRLPADSDLAASARDDGFDLRFTAADGVTQLSHEIERFDGATGELVAWVRVPSLSDTINTTIFLYFGDPTATDQQNVTNVWNSNFVGVWHLDETAGTAIADSTASARTGTKTAATTPMPIAGMIGGGQRFAGLTDGIAIGNSAELDIPSITIEMWIEVDACPNDVYRRIIDFPESFQSSWVVAYPCAGSPIVNDKSIVLELPDSNKLQTPANTLTSEVAHHLVFKTNPVELWLDGVQRTLSAAPFGLAQNNQVAVIGNREGSPDRAVLGVMDEVRISKVRRTPDFIVTSFNNQRAGSTMLTIGAVETAP